MAGATVKKDHDAVIGTGGEGRTFLIPFSSGSQKLRQRNTDQAQAAGAQ
jgi:hypothetical protein